MDEGGRGTAWEGLSPLAVPFALTPSLMAGAKMAFQLEVGVTFAAHLHHMHHSASPAAASSFGLSLAPLPALSQVSPQVSSCFNDSSTAIR